MPQLIVRASKREGIWDVRVDREMEAALSSLRGRSSMFPSTGRLDITFYPMVSLVNNYLDHLFDWSVRIAPAFAMNLWPGGRFTIQPIFPVAHYLANKADHKRFIQPGCINLSQQIVFNKRWQLSAAVGSFIPERWGVQAKATFQSIVTAAAIEAKRNVRIVDQLSQPADHPINIFHPEGAYLKGLMLIVE